VRVNLELLRSAGAKRTWLLLVLAWAIIRTIAVKDFFSQYGIHPWIYLSIDLLSSIPYAHYSANLVISYLDKEWASTRKNFFLTAIFFYIPDVYIFTAANRIPKELLIGFVVSVLIFSAVAMAGIWRKIKDGRQN
jgi:hypothetical protein